MRKLSEKNVQTISARSTIHKKKTWWISQKLKHHVEKEKYHWYINFQNSEKVRMCFQSWCTDIKIIETCLEKYQIMIRKVKTEFASKI